MALATRCPHCGTVFKVASDQLKLRGGLVRCGICQQVFNGVEGLVDKEAPRAGLPTSGTLPPESRQPPAAPQDNGRNVAGAGAEVPSSAAGPMPAAPGAEPVSGVPDGVAAGGFPPHPVATPASTEPVAEAPRNGPPPDAAPNERRAPDPLLRMTLLDVAQAGHGGPNPFVPVKPSAGGERSDADAASGMTPDPLADAIDELNARPMTGSLPATQDDEEDRAIDPDLPEPSFLAGAPRQNRLSGFLPAGVALLAIVLAVQVVYLARHRIVSAVPQAETVIGGLCAVLRCEAGLPADIEAVAIESSELQQASGGSSVFVLAFSLQNKSATAQAWPHVELTLNDTAEQPVVRRVFTPQDYVDSPERRQQGLARQASASFRLRFELTQQKAAGYRLYMFYP